MEVSIEMGKDSEDQGEDSPKAYDKYELECKLRTLMEAEEIKADKELMAQLKPLMEKKVKAIKSLAELRQVAKSKGA